MSAHAPIHPARPAEDDELPPELLRIIQGLARMNARRDYAAQQSWGAANRNDELD